jgi:Xaa-Pro dipeptidase
MTIERQLPFDVVEFRDRVGRIQETMASRGLAGLILFSPQNVYYVSGMDTETMYGTEAVIVTAHGDPTLVVHEFERGRADNSCWLSSVRTFPSTDLFVDAVIDAARELGFDHGEIGVEQRTWAPLAAPISPAGFDRIRQSLAGATLHDPWGIVEELRLRKSAAEVAYMREAGRLTEIGVAAGLAAVAEHVEDTTIAAEICHAIYRAGSELMCWGPIVASGFRAGAPHSNFSGRQLLRGDTVLLELTGQVRRYVAPALRTAIIGTPSSEIVRISDAALNAVAAVIETAGPGVPASEVAQAGTRALSSLPEGLVFHGTFGYPVGIGFPPTWGEYRGYLLRPDNHRALDVGMAFHLAVSFRKYGEFGICHSQTLLVTDNGAEALTSFPASLHIVD